MVATVKAPVMPKPIHEGFSFVAGYHPRMLIQDRPEHAARIGLVAAEWAALENELIQVFEFSIFSMTDEKYGGIVARTALENIDSLRARLDVIEALLERRVPEERYK